MTDFSNIKFESADGVYFEAYIEDEERTYFLDLSILEDMTNKRTITDRAVALVLFHSIKNRLFTMCLMAHKESPNWPTDKPLPILKKHIR